MHAASQYAFFGCNTGTRNALPRTQCNQVTVWMLFTIWRCHQHSSNLIMSSEDWECKKLTDAKNCWLKSQEDSSLISRPPLLSLHLHGSVNGEDMEALMMSSGWEVDVVHTSLVPWPLAPKEKPGTHCLHMRKIFRYICCNKLCVLPCPNEEDYTNQECRAF